MSIHCLIVDDEPLARKVIEKHLEAYEQIRIEGSCENALAAYEILNRKKVDLLFLDIEMPGIGGLQLIRALKDPPAVVFITAYSEFAAESYELEAIDYLVKPVTAERLRRCLTKFFRQLPGKEEANDFIFIRQEGKMVKIFYRDILFIEARKDYLMLHTAQGSQLTHMTMKRMEATLPVEQFIRVHRSFILAIPCITSFAPSEISMGKKIFPIGEKYRKAVLALSDRLK